jgi:hypothetical protein
MFRVGRLHQETADFELFVMAVAVGQILLAHPVEAVHEL